MADSVHMEIGPEHRDAAVLWLRGEDAWQWSAKKFSIEANARELAENGVVDGGWYHQFNNYPPKVALYREAESWLHVMQYAGKTAATARGLFVTTQAIAEGCGDDDRPRLSAESLTLLDEHFALTRTGVGDYRAVDIVWGSPFEDKLQKLHDALLATDNARLVAAAEDVMYEGVTYFVHKIEIAHGAMGGDLVMPKPGLSSGNIELWVPGAD